ncbi:MAG: cobalamin-dependent protein [Magnetococcales bacterium]|nr:cobalamin-dependent protein [Magnetococcales bacterium]
MSQIRVLLLTSSCATSGSSDSVAPSLGLYRLRHNLVHHGIDCDVIDQQLTTDGEIFSRLDNTAYDIIGISVTHWMMESDLTLLWALRDIVQHSGHDAMFIAGGQSAAMNAQVWLENGFDLVVLGYAEATLLKICQHHGQRGNRSIHERFQNVAGVAFLDQNNQKIVNPTGPLGRDEFLQWSTDAEIKIPYIDYWRYVGDRATHILTFNNRSFIVKNARLYTSSRCLAKCGYCSSAESFFKATQEGSAPFFMLNAEEVYQLIVNHVNTYGAQAFSFNDEDFLVGNRIGIQRIFELCERIIISKNEGILPNDLKFSCQTRITDFLTLGADRKRHINRPLIQIMKDAGFHNISLGVETFSDRLLQCPSVNKSYMNTHDIHSVLNNMMDLGLFPTINLILGIPETCEDDLRLTIQSALHYLSMPCQISSVIYMRSFPGAPLWNAPGYPTMDKCWTHPKTGHCVKIPAYYCMHDPDMASLFDKLEEITNEELHLLRIANGWNDSRLLFRTATAIATFSAIAKWIKSSELVTQTAHLMQNMANI